jgi:hypothetical protein
MLVPVLAAVLGFGAGALGAWLVLRTRRPAAIAPVASEPELAVEPKPLVAVRERVDDTAPARAVGAAPPHLLTLIADAMRDPLQKLRRSQEVPRDALELLERIAWQTRMLVSRPRPMRAAPTSPIALLQEAAEQIPLLRDGSVGASWSLLNRQPVHVDADRMRAAFRCLLLAGAELAGEGGRLGIKIQPGGAAGFPVQIEMEIGRRGTELDPFSLLVARHLIEGQGGRIDLDGNVTRILLRSAAAEEPVASVA